MALATKPSSPSQGRVHRVWKTPTTRTVWLWLATTLFLCAVLFGIYFYTLKTQQYPSPYTDPLRLFGIVSFALVLIVASYTLRRRFMRQLGGSVQSWLWVHTWFGIAAILITLWHSNFLNIYPYFYFSLSTLTEGLAGMSALYSLLLLVITGIIGRFLDMGQARIIAHEANRNGTGIIQSVEDRLREIDLTVGRLSAGKSVEFKQYCTQALSKAGTLSGPPPLSPQEKPDFQRAWDALSQHAQLTRSLQRQKRARTIIQGWRYIHIAIACVAFAIILLHSTLELIKLALQLTGHSL